MKNTFKKLLSVILCAVLLFTTASVAFAADETRTVVDSGYCGAQGENLTWTLYSDGELVISGEGEMAKEIVPWKEYYSSIDVITVEEGVTSLAKWALYADLSGKEYSRTYLVNLPKSLKVVTPIEKHTDTNGQTIVVCYAGSEEDWSKVELLNYTDSVTIGPDFSQEFMGSCAKMYFNGEKPEAFCHIYNAQGNIDSPGEEIDVYTHYYTAGNKAEKIIMYSIIGGKEEIISEFAVGKDNKTTVVIPEAKKGELYVRADLVAADGNVIASSENCHIKNDAIDNRPLNEKIKDTMEELLAGTILLGGFTFVYGLLAPVVGVVLSPYYLFLTIRELVRNAKKN